MSGIISGRDGSMNMQLAVHSTFLHVAFLPEISMASAFGLASSSNPEGETLQPAPPPPLPLPPHHQPSARNHVWERTVKLGDSKILRLQNLLPAQRT